MEGNAGRNAVAAESQWLCQVMPALSCRFLLMASRRAIRRIRSLRGAESSQQIAHPHYRSLAAGFLDSWEAHAADVFHGPQPLALLVAAQGEKAHQEEQTVELVWTGPDTGSIPRRPYRTSASSSLSTLLLKQL